MYRITGLLLFVILYLVLPSFAKATGEPVFSGVLKSRKVVGVIYFKNDNKIIRLSKDQREEINRIASLISSQRSSDKIVRVEGFAIKNGQNSGLLNTSLSRAKAVWYYLREIDSDNSENLFLTGFNASQSISKLQGERVEIAIYENPFDEKMDIYSNN